MSKPVILVIENSIDYTGALHSVLTNALTLKDSFTFYFLLPTNSRAAKFVVRENFTAFELPLRELNKSFQGLLLYCPALLLNEFRLNRILRKHKVDLIVSNDFYNLLPAIHRLFWGRTPYVTFVRLIPDRFPKVLVNTWFFFHFHFASKIIAVSGAVKRHIKKHEKVIQVYNEKPSGAGYKFYDYDIQCRNVLYLSNYISGKGLEYAIKAFAQLPEKYSDWKLKFVGSDMGLKKNGIYKKMLLDEIARLGLQSRIVLEDFSANVVEEYKQAAIVLNFSDSESFSLTCMEAMYIGRPVIATKSGGPEEMITSGFNGELVNVRDVVGMAGAMKKLMNDAELRKEYGRRAHETVSKNFGTENTTLQLVKIFNEAII
jgi:L-malate glycosyltransferase